MECLRQNGCKREREKKTAGSGTSWTLCRSAVPWRFTTRFRPADRFCLLEMVPRCFSDTLSPTTQWGREKSAPRPCETDPFRRRTPVLPYWLKLSFSHIYISQCSHCVFHVVGFEVYACARAKTDILMTCSLGGTATGLLLPYFILAIFIDVFPKTIARSFDGLLTLSRKCLCIPDG